MGFQFWEIDDDVRVQGLSREVDLAERGADIDRLRRLKRSADHIEALQGGASVPSRRIFSKGPMAGLSKTTGVAFRAKTYSAAARTTRGWVRTASFRPRRRQEIGFQENPAARWDLGAAKDIHDLSKKRAAEYMQHHASKAAQ